MAEPPECPEFGRAATMPGRVLERLGRGRPGLESLGLGRLQALATSDSWLSSFRTRIRAHGTRQPCAGARDLSQPFSFIRTLTVGFGITPNLLTLPFQFPEPEGARGLGLRHPYRRWGFSPRPENIGRPEWTT